MSDREYNNELTIRFETEDKCQEFLDWMSEDEEENPERYEGISVIRNTYPR